MNGDSTSPHTRPGTARRRSARPSSLVRRRAHDVRGMLEHIESPELRRSLLTAPSWRAMIAEAVALGHNVEDLAPTPA